MDLICGINPVIEALHAGSRHFDRLLVVKGLRNRRISEAIARASQLGVPLRFESRETLDRMSGGLPHQGIIAVVSAKPLLSLEQLLEAVRDPGLLLVLDGVQDPRNLGAIIRTAEAAGADGVLIPERHSAGLSETVSRASAGALEHVRVGRLGNLVQALEALKSRGFWVVGFDGEARERWDGIDYRRPVALVLGGEGRGIRRLVREHCDHVVALPLFGHVSSLNVSVAAGIGLYEVIRQRGAIPSHVKPIPPAAAAGERRVVGPAPEDAEYDPGLLQPLEADAGEEPEDEAAGVVHIEEEEVWTAPTVIRHSGHLRTPQRQRMGKGRRRRRGGPRPGAVPPSPAGPPAPQHSRPEAAEPSPAPLPGEGPAEGSGGARPGQIPDGGRRRRRGRRRKGASPANGVGPSPIPTGAASGEGAPPENPSGQGPAPDRQRGGRGRRRRWRGRR